jgi:hypothetical protein
VPQEPIRVKYRPSPAEPRVSSNGPRLDLKVIFTDLRRTAAALATARTMARGLGARITLLAAQVVPYPLPVAAPDVPVEFTERMLNSILPDNDDADTTVEIYLCRDRNETIRRALAPDSVVIIGARRWRDWRLTRILRHDGRQVVAI